MAWEKPFDWVSEHRFSPRCTTMVSPFQSLSWSPTAQRKQWRRSKSRVCFFYHCLDSRRTRTPWWEGWKNQNLVLAHCLSRQYAVHQEFLPPPCLLMFVCCFKPFFLTHGYLPGLISSPRMSCLHRKGLALWQARQIWGKSASWAGCKGLLSAWCSATREHVQVVGFTPSEMPCTARNSHSASDGVIPPEVQYCLCFICSTACFHPTSTVLLGPVEGRLRQRMRKQRKQGKNKVAEGFIKLHSRESQFGAYLACTI